MQGKTSNFTHKVLKETVIDFYYNNSSKSLHQFLEFQEAVLYRALLLVAAMVSPFLKSCGHSEHPYFNRYTVSFASSEPMALLMRRAPTSTLRVPNQHTSNSLGKWKWCWPMITMVRVMRKISVD